MTERMLHKQYQTDANLNARISLHRNFSTNPYPGYKWIFDRFDMPEPACILELGCGSGDLWKENLDRIPVGWDITLTDFSGGMLASARCNLSSSGRAFTFKVADAQDLPFEDGMFDAVIANHMLYHVPDRARAFAEVGRVLKPGGKFYASTNSETHMAELWGVFRLYVPDRVKHFLVAGSGFTLENGAAQLSVEFGDIQRYDRANSLRVTDAEAVVAYLASIYVSTDTPLTEAQLAAIRADVAARIQAEGVFIINKSMGMFVAQVP